MQTVAVIFGSRSAEHDVSIVTAIASIIKPLELSGKYKVEPIYIAKDGAWYWDAKLKDINLYTRGEIDPFLKKQAPVSVQFDGGMKLVKNAGLARLKTQQIDVVFPATHGTFGEDGTLQGLLEMANVAYVGCGVAASAIAMDKALAKQVASANDIPVTKAVTFTKSEYLQNKEGYHDKISQLNLPIFIKPAHLGSSIGITKISKYDDLENALEVALHYDDRVVAEEGVHNLIEVTLPIIGNDTLEPALLEMPLTSTEDFFDFDTKYMQGGKKGKGGKKGSGKSQGAQGYSQIPAPLDKTLYEKAESVGLSVYKAFGCTGIARIDMLIDEKAKKVYFNEANPLPGDLYAHNFNRAGISNVELVDKLVGFAKERAASRASLATTFSTNYLKQF